MKKEKYYYFAVSNDRFEFPITPIFDNYKELSNYTGLSIQYLKDAIRRKYLNFKYNCYFVKLERLED